MQYDFSYRNEMTHDQKVIGGMLKNPDRGDEFIGATGLRSDHYAEDTVRAVHIAFLEARARGGSLDLYPFFSTLPASAQETLGKFDRLFEWAEEGFVSGDLFEGMKKIVERSKRRRIGELAISLSNLSGNSHDLEGGIADAQKTLEKILADIPSTGIIDMQTAITGALESLTAAKQKQNLFSGLKPLDEYFSTVTGGELITIGARPGIGKSTLAVQMMIASAERGLPGFFLAAEMTAEQIMVRQLASKSGLSVAEMKARLEASKGTDGIYNAAQSFASLPTYFFHTEKTPLPDLLVRARRMVQTHGIKILFVDYLQLIESGLPSSQGRERQIASMSGALKQFALKTKTTVVSVAQLNREVDNRVNKIPQLSDFRESGAIEQDSDACFLMYRTPNQPDSLDDFETVLLCDKNRNGKKGEVKILFRGKTTGFEEIPEYRSFGDRQVIQEMDIDIGF
jgi:replicative DNA helicase